MKDLTTRYLTILVTWLFWRSWRFGRIGKKPNTDHDFPPSFTNKVVGEENNKRRTPQVDAPLKAQDGFDAILIDVSSAKIRARNNLFLNWKTNKLFFECFGLKCPFVESCIFLNVYIMQHDNYQKIKEKTFKQDRKAA